MASLGEFRVAAQTGAGDTFTLNGEVFTVTGKDLTIDFMEFAEKANSGLDTAQMEGMAALLGIMRAMVVDEDRDRFIAHAKAIGLPVETLMSIVGAVIEAKTGRPTEQPSGSPVGLSSTGASSRAPSSYGAPSPIQQDPRIQELRPISEVGLSLVG